MAVESSGNPCGQRARGNHRETDPLLAHVIERHHHGVLPAGRNEGQCTQSVLIFSGTQRCGTIENPRWLKYPGQCVNAHSRSNPACRARCAQLVDQPGADARAAGFGRHHERTHLATPALSGASSAQAMIRVPSDSDDEPLRMHGDLVERPREKVPFLAIGRDESVQPCRVRRVGAAQGDGSRGASSIRVSVRGALHVSKRRIESVERFVGVRLGDDERRQQSDHRSRPCD